MLQQYLPFTVLKLSKPNKIKEIAAINVATVLTVYGIETSIRFVKYLIVQLRCNSTYRLRY